MLSTQARVRVGGVSQVADRCGERVDAGRLQECFSVLQLHGIQQCGQPEEVGDEGHGLGDHFTEPEVMPVPFHHRELGLVQPAGLAAAKHAAHCVDIGIAVGEQPLHIRFRGGLKIQRARGMACDAQAVDIGVGGRVAAQRGRGDFENFTGAEEAACPFQHVGALPRHGNAGRRPPGHAPGTANSPIAVPAIVVTPALKSSCQE